jgi:transposase-like protein
VYRKKGVSQCRFFHCNDCKTEFSIFHGTIFYNSQVDLRKWFFAINTILLAKKGISALQLQREIGCSYKTVWRMLNLIRKAMGNEKERALFEAIVEIDETYVGGKPAKKNKHADDKKNKRGRGTSKIPVIGVKNRTTKGVYAKVALPDKDGKKLTGKQLLNVLLECCNSNITVMTDEFRGYDILDRKDSKFQRFVINHKEAYVNGDVHTNGIEGFWSLFKRGFYGTYHKMSLKHMQNYLNEFCFRQNNMKKKGDDLFELLVRQCVGTTNIICNDIIAA